MISRNYFLLNIFYQGINVLSEIYLVMVTSDVAFSIRCTMGMGEAKQPTISS